MSPSQAFDLVIAGGGTAGCVLAARASEDPSRRVLLVEAGSDPRPIPDIIRDPGRQGELIRDASFVRSYGVRRPNGSSFSLISGRVMGGGSSVNNLAVVRPMARDFVDWERYGGSAWSYEALLPLMRLIESDEDFGEGPAHGSKGPLRLHRDFKLDDPADPPVRALIDAALELGLPKCHDLNGPEPFGICSSPYNVVGGNRQSTSVAYLDPARGRSNLTILSDTVVSRLVLERSRVREVALLQGSKEQKVVAGEVVLAAGVFHSPQILMLSGIGPPATIEGVGLSVKHPLPGVGQNYQDHAVVYVNYEATPRLRDDHLIPKIRLVAKSREQLDCPDLHVLIHAPVRRSATRPDLLPISVRLLDHRSVGAITLASADPAVNPVVDPALLAHPDDVRALVNGIRLVERLTSHPELAEFYRGLADPVRSDQWEQHARSSYVSYHHGTGTCRIGPADDQQAVVDERLRVHGIDNLRVADASVLPTIPHANTNLAAILVGEIAAREIVGR